MHLSLPLLLPLLPTTFAWDGFGHRTVGYLAQRYFTPLTNSTLTSLLSLTPQFDISDAAAWADTVRDAANLPWSKNWHFINPKADNPNTHVCSLNYTIDCPSNGCIIAAIMNQTSLLLDTSSPAITRRNATMWLLHFFGDLHQPMHTSGWKFGGNAVRPVCWDTQAPCGGNRNLHAVWDGMISRKLRALPEDTTEEMDRLAARMWAGDIYAKQQQQREEGGVEKGVCADLKGPGCVLGYAAESNRLVCSNAMRDGEEWVMGQDLSKRYYEENKAVVEEQVGKAGVRLAGWMNEVVRVLVEKGEGRMGDL